MRPGNVIALWIAKPDTKVVLVVSAHSAPPNHGKWLDALGLAS